MSTAVRVSYDAEADAAYLYLVDPIDDDAVVATHSLDLGRGARLLVERGGDGRLLGIEVLQASHALPDLLQRVAPDDPT